MSGLMGVAQEDKKRIGRPPKEFDLEAAMDLLERGERIPAVAEELGISIPTLRKRVRELQEKQGVLLQYRALQSLQLTELQARVLDAITPEKINEAPLKELVQAYKILKDKELVVEGKPSEVKGLVHHLIFLEKQEQARKNGSSLEAIDAEFDDSKNEDGVDTDAPPTQGALLTTLSQLDQDDF